MGDSFGQSCRTFAQTGDHVANCTGLIKRLSGARLILNVQIGGVGTPSVSAVAANVSGRLGAPVHRFQIVRVMQVIIFIFQLR